MSFDSIKVEEKIAREWKGFHEALRSYDRMLFREMMNFVYKYLPSIQTMPDYEKDFAILLSIVFDQDKTIKWLKKETERLKKKLGLE